MITFFDLLIIVSMALIAASLLSVVLMFLIKNKTVQHVCFYIVVALNVYVGYVGFSINWLGFEAQAFLALALALLSIAALVLSIIRKSDEKLFLYVRIATAAMLLIGVANALLI